MVFVSCMATCQPSTAEHHILSVESTMTTSGATEFSARNTKCGRIPEILDVSTIHLRGEEDKTVPVFDTCDTVRRRIRAILKNPAVTQAAFLLAVAETLRNGRRLQGVQLDRFLALKGPWAGNTSGIYYGAYVFFEKARIRDCRPKSDDRLIIERQHPNGMDTKRVRNRVWVPQGKIAQVDKHGVIRSQWPNQRRYR